MQVWVTPLSKKTRAVVRLITELCPTQAFNKQLDIGMP